MPREAFIEGKGLLMRQFTLMNEEADKEYVYLKWASKFVSS